MSMHEYANFHITMYRACITNWKSTTKRCQVFVHLQCIEPRLQWKLWFWATAFRTGKAFQICNSQFLPGTVTFAIGWWTFILNSILQKENEVSFSDCYIATMMFLLSTTEQIGIQAQDGDITYFVVSSTKESDEGTRRRRGASANSRHLWPSAIVPYTISPSFTGMTSWFSLWKLSRLF